jgi:sulfate adenylyltransferase subunit 2
MSELSHLDQLEAEAIYIIREVAASCEKPVSDFDLISEKTAQLCYI